MIDLQLYRLELEFKCKHRDLILFFFLVLSLKRCIVRKSILHLANLGLIVFIAGYCADKLNLGEETQSGMAFIVKFCGNMLADRRLSAYDSNDDRNT